MKIRSLFYYPVKSLAGIATDTLPLDRFGPAADRRWMLVDDQGQFVTQRKHPALVRIRPSLAGDQLLLDIPGHGAVAVTAGSREREVTVWRDHVAGVLEAQGGASAAISAFLGKPVSLVYMPESVTRPTRHQDLAGIHPVSFADGFPFLVTNQASLDDLALRLPGYGDMRRFRPNVVIEGAAAWQEDDWQTLLLGEVRVRMVKPCSRCIMTTVDPDTGERCSGGEPLKTLAGFRRTGDGVMFGVNGVHDNTGTLRVGDPVTLIDSKE
ncbi:MOSC domain-containing protein [Marinobacter sp.]|uniref:MOSC domain-containing protein n=1 Tax=Marinobacter sp. TaxID=50741 RepID=UPI00356448D2